MPIPRAPVLMRRAVATPARFLTIALLLVALQPMFRLLAEPHAGGSPHDHAHSVNERGKREPVAGREEAPSRKDEGNRRMAARLDRIRRESNSVDNTFLSERAVDRYRELITDQGPEISSEDWIDLHFRFAMALLQAGDLEEALPEFQAIESELLKRLGPEKRPVLAKVLKQWAICYLRLGELENCLHNHNAESCLFPIRGGGMHILPEGSRGAIAVLERLLELYPGDLAARWLLNVSYMTLGEYPEKVPHRHLIDPSFFRSDHEIGAFPDVAGSLGIDVDDLAGGVVMEDFDRDGYLDLMVSGWGLESQLRVFRNMGDGSFEERTEAAGLRGLYSGLNLVHGDYNNDGLPDVLVLRGAWLRKGGHHPNSLLRNNGDFTFSDVTEEAGMLSFHPTQTAAWFDYNSDGWLDIFIGNESLKDDPHACELYRNNGDGTFTECAAQHGVDFVKFVKGATSGDYNNDGRPDLFLTSADGGYLMLLRNDGPASGGDGAGDSDWRFTDATEMAGLAETHRAFPCWFWDYNNDGWLDVMAPGYSIQDAGDVAADVLGLPHLGSKARLFRNLGNGTFSDVSEALGVSRVIHAMGANFGDLDNDGWLDFYCGTGDPDYGTLIPNLMFRNNGGRGFQDVTTSGGFGQLQKGHGIAFGDIDNDGDQDVYSVVGGAFSADNYHNQLFANPGHGNNWLKLQLVGESTNRMALGARIKVVVQTSSGERAIYRHVGSGGSFGASSFRQEIGLGNAASVTRLEVFWPVSGRTQIFGDLRLNECYRIREGVGEAQAVTLVGFELPVRGGAKSEEHGHGHHHHHH